LNSPRKNEPIEVKREVKKLKGKPEKVVQIFLVAILSGVIEEEGQESRF
jgi:hypothetical protein